MRSKNLWAPRCDFHSEYGVRPGRGAGDHVFDTERACQLRPSKTVEVDRAQRTDVTSQIRASSVRSTPSAPMRQRPAFQGQNSSMISMTTEPRS